MIDIYMNGAEVHAETPEEAPSKTADSLVFSSKL